MSSWSVNTFVLSLGANCGNREGAVRDAMDWLREMLYDFKASEIYETLPVGHAGNNYINGVVSGVSSLDAAQLDCLCKLYEKERGRDEESRRMNLVPVDIDIVIANGHILRPKDFRCGFFQKGYLSITKEPEPAGWSVSGSSAIED